MLALILVSKLEILGDEQSGNSEKAPEFGNSNNPFSLYLKKSLLMEIKCKTRNILVAAFNYPP